MIGASSGTDRQLRKEPFYFRGWPKAKRRSYSARETVATSERLHRWSCSLRRRGRVGWRLQPKHQTPKKPQIPNPNPPRDVGRFELQILMSAAMPSNWSLRFEGSLVLGSWYLEFSLIPLDNDETRMTNVERMTKL